MLVIFDWDDTLMDSTRKIVVCMQKASVDAGLPLLPPEVIENIIGLGLPEAIAALYPDASAEAAERIRLSYAEHFVSLDTTPMPLFDGVERRLLQLREQGVQLAVATGKSRRGLDRILTALDMHHLFFATRCADETASKPHPLMLQQLLDQAGKLSQHAVMVGDTEYDMAMAQALDMPRIAVSYGAHHIDRLRQYNPAVCADHFDQVYQWIANRLNG